MKKNASMFFEMFSNWMAAKTKWIKYSFTYEVTYFPFLELWNDNWIVVFGKIYSMWDFSGTALKKVLWFHLKAGGHQEYSSHDNVCKDRYKMHYYTQVTMLGFNHLLLGWQISVGTS